LALWTSDQAGAAALLGEDEPDVPDVPDVLGVDVSEEDDEDDEDEDEPSEPELNFTSVLPDESEDAFCFFFAASAPARLSVR
jgi:hypothetical protein